MDNGWSNEASVSISIIEYMARKAELAHIPYTGTFELLPFCNLSCHMCYIRQNPTQEGLRGLMPSSFWYDIIKQCMECGMLNVLFTGGETFLYPEFRELYEQVYSLPVYITLNTNATLLDDETVKWLAKCPPKLVNISLYGTSDSTYFSLCGASSAFTKVMHAFDLLKINRIPFRVHTTLVSENIEEYNEFVNICNYYQVPLQMVSYMFPPYRKNHTIGDNEGRLDPKTAAELKLRFTRDGYNDPDKFHDYVERTIYQIDHPHENRIYGLDAMDCKAGLCTFWVDWQGCVSTCGIMNQEKNDLHNMTFREAWENIRVFQSKARFPEECAYCNLRVVCPTCMASIFCETGGFEYPSSYCCDFAKRYTQLLREELANV